MLRFINVPLISEPLNWGIVFLIATIWLLAYHHVMVAFMAMQQGSGGAPAAPGSGQAIPPSNMMPAMLPFDTDAATESQFGFVG